jgi:predicted metal-dependent HD superfamily phosphohydrolase
MRLALAVADQRPLLGLFSGTGVGEPVFVNEYWREAWSLLGVGTPEAGVLNALLASYGDPARSYHTLQHLEECFMRWSEAQSLATRAGEVLVALWFHDAVYDTHATDNEQKSAEWAVEVIGTAGGSVPQSERVRDLILATRHAASPSPGDAALIVDIDLSILGAPAARFDEYEEQVRREYAWVPEPVFKATRARILAEFLARPSIFTTAHFATRYETAARENLSRSLARLT